MSKSDEMMELVGDLETVCDAKTFIDPRTRETTLNLVRAKLQAIADSLPSWISVDTKDERLKRYTGKMVLIRTPECLVKQAYFSGISFCEPWGDEFAGSKQPKVWMPLPLPPKDEK